MKTIETQYLISIVSFVCLGSLLWYTLQYGWGWLAVSVVYYKIIVGFFGNQIAQHRYFSHRSFATTNRKEWTLYLLSLTTGVNPVIYALAHRHHHQYSDQVQDLHSVHNYWLDIFSPITGRTSYTGDIEISRVLSADQRKINHYWAWIFLLYALAAAVVSWKLAVFVVLAGPAWNYLHMILFRVWLVHAKLPGSYRNFETTDRSWNNKCIQILDIGEGLHNNHHQYPHRYNQAVQPGEFDPAGWIVKHVFDSKKVDSQQ